MVGLIYKHSADIIREKFSVAPEPLISSLDPRVKTYVMGDFNINLLDHNLSPPRCRKLYQSNDVQFFFINH